MKQDWRIDPILILLFIGIWMSLGALMFVAGHFPNNGQLFIITSGLVTASSTGFFLRVNPKSMQEQDTAAGVTPGTTAATTTVNTTTKTSSVQPDASPAKKDAEVTNEGGR